MRTLLNIGERLGALVVLAREPNTPAGATRWRVRCDCGREDVRSGSRLSRQFRRCVSCQAKLSAGGRSDAGHYAGHKREYSSWHNMIVRCTHPGTPYWHNYGGRGIRVTEKWLDFAVFIADMGPMPSTGLTLDRVDNDGNYEPGNCRWATVREQSLNQRRSKANRLTKAALAMATVSADAIGSRCDGAES